MSVQRSPHFPMRPTMITRVGMLPKLWTQGKTIVQQPLHLGFESTALITTCFCIALRTHDFESPPVRESASAKKPRRRS